MKSVFVLPILLLFVNACNGKINNVAFTTTDSATVSLPIIDSANCNCKQITCAVWAQVILAEQKLYLYQNGILKDTFLVSTGDRRHKTPKFDTKFGGRMYKKYTSKKFPGGNYMGLGNMPYVIFIKGGYAIHGTTVGNFNRLGRVASHGCIRLHPVSAKVLFDLIKTVGANNTWISVE